ncbi:hypothetical protein EW146_g8967 [Bondarzewia mesenterica]|uniref:Uncharacterized protein n=1 Tax=Bondarzewia mesenterica TaxID=1095465 RepID=A0A4V3XD64_9AGAM|nr:hypothetical protein EW146_g8967 [Bondarzewia mesenterica]
MNNPKTMVLGWGSLVVGAGVSFYFAKKSINERRKQQDDEGTRPTAKLDWRDRIAQEEQKGAGGGGEGSQTVVGQGGASSPSASTEGTKDGAS